MSYRVSREVFERLVEKAIVRVPRRYRKLMKNIAVMVEDYPSREDLDALGLERHELLGMFKGMPHEAHEAFFERPHFPDAIMLYQRNIEDICGNEEDLIEEIRITLEHEIGHFFGLSEDELLQYE